jgi:Carboxypeptidase regulatory-like domain
MSTVDSEGYAPSYYPGTANVAEAQRVSVKGGQELSGINFALTAARLARVRGRVTTAAGAPPTSPMMVMVNARDISSMMTMPPQMGQTRGDGSFQVAGIAPGTYNITARQMGPPTGQQEVALAQLTVSNEDIDNVLLVLARGAVARGTISSDDGTPLPFQPGMVRVMQMPAEPNTARMGMSMPTVNDDWTFELPGLFERGFLRASIADSGDWFFKGVYHRDQDVTDTPLEFVPGQTVEGFQVVFSQKATEITGLVRDERGQAVLDSTVVVFPGDTSKWGYQSRYLRTSRVDQEGRFRIRNLPPHDDYRLLAVKELEDGRSADPEFLESIRDFAARVTLREGQTSTQDLKIQQVP